MNMRPLLSTPAFTLWAAAMMILLGVLTSPVNAQGNCGERDAVISQLEERFGETRQFVGLSNEASSAVELFVSEKTGTWTIIVTMPNGTSCLMTSGDGFQLIVDTPKGEAL